MGTRQSTRLKEKLAAQLLAEAATENQDRASLPTLAESESEGPDDALPPRRKTTLQRKTTAQKRHAGEQGEGDERPKVKRSRIKEAATQDHDEPMDVDHNDQGGSGGLLTPRHTPQPRTKRESSPAPVSARSRAPSSPLFVPERTQRASSPAMAAAAGLMRTRDRSSATAVGPETYGEPQCTVGSGHKNAIAFIGTQDKSAYIVDLASKFPTLQPGASGAFRVQRGGRNVGDGHYQALDVCQSIVSLDDDEKITKLPPTYILVSLVHKPDVEEEEDSLQEPFFVTSTEYRTLVADGDASLRHELTKVIGRLKELQKLVAQKDLPQEGHAWLHHPSYSKRVAEYASSLQRSVDYLDERPKERARKAAEKKKAKAKAKAKTKAKETASSESDDTEHDTKRRRRKDSIRSRKHDQTRSRRHASNVSDETDGDSS